MNRNSRRTTGGLLGTGIAVITLLLTACSSDSDSSGGSATIDCTVATAAVETYSTALNDILIGLTDDDVAAARAGAEAFAPAALAVTRALPGLPPEAEDFVTRSEDASQLVLDSLAGGASGETILDELDALFSDPAFNTAGEAVEGLFTSACGGGTPSQ